MRCIPYLEGFSLVHVEAIMHLTHPESHGVETARHLCVLELSLLLDSVWLCHRLLHLVAQRGILSKGTLGGRGNCNVYIASPRTSRNSCCVCHAF